MKFDQTAMVEIGCESRSCSGRPDVHVFAHKRTSSPRPLRIVETKELG
jgi:hypothetical protein